MSYFFIDIKSDTKLIECVLSALLSIGRINNFRKDLMWALEISLREILANSIIHGNKEDKNKRVSIELEWDDNIFKITVEDEGKGFLYKKEKPKIIKKGEFPELSGRGWLIVENKMDSLDFKKEKRSFKVIAKKNIK